MNRRTYLATTATVLSPVVAGCGGDDSERGDGPENAVDIDQERFRPLRLSVSPGEMVTWRNGDPFEHTVTSGEFHEDAVSWELDETLGDGQTTTHSFDETGVYEYYCSHHGRETMCGAVLVGDVELDESLPCEGGP